MAECVTDVLTTFWRLLWSITESAFFISKYFNITQKPAFCPAFAPPLHEKSHLTWSDLYKMKQFHWLLCAAKNCDWSRKIAPLSNLTRASLLVENLQRKKNWTAKSTNLEENAGKIKSVFVIGAALWAEKLGRCLENYRGWKNTLGKLVVTVKSSQPRGHSIRERKWRSRFLSSVVGDSQISLINCRRHILAAILLTVGCG